MRRWRRLAVALLIGSIALGLALSVSAFLWWRSSNQGPASMSAEEAKLLSLIPPSIRGTCNGFVHPGDADLEGNPQINGGAVVGVYCSAKPWIVLRFELYERRKTMNAGDSSLDIPAQNRCLSEVAAKARYFSHGERLGHILCFKNGGQPTIIWTDDRDLILADAEVPPGSRRSPFRRSLYHWWLSLDLGKIIYGRNS